MIAFAPWRPARSWPRPARPAPRPWSGWRAGAPSIPGCCRACPAARRRARTPSADWRRSFPFAAHTPVPGCRRSGRLPPALGWRRILPRRSAPRRGPCIPPPDGAYRAGGGLSGAGSGCRCAGGRNAAPRPSPAAPSWPRCRARSTWRRPGCPSAGPASAGDSARESRCAGRDSVCRPSEEYCRRACIS